MLYDFRNKSENIDTSPCFFRFMNSRQLVRAIENVEVVSRSSVIPVM